MPNIRMPLLLFTLSGLLMTGCQYIRRSGVVRVWSDYNTLAAPGFFFEELDSAAYRRHYLTRRNWIDNRHVRPPRFFQDVRTDAAGNPRGTDMQVAPQNAPITPQLEPNLPPFPEKPPVEGPDAFTPIPEPTNVPEHPGELSSPPPVPPSSLLPPPLSPVPEAPPAPTATQQRNDVRSSGYQTTRSP